MSDIQEIQTKVREWSKQNFPAEDIGGAVGRDTMRDWLRTLEVVGRCSHEILKAEQDIRGGLSNLNCFSGKHLVRHVVTSVNNTRRDYEYHRRHEAMDWKGEAVDGVEDEWPHKLLGVVEECGELIEAINDGTDAEVRDALGDIFIFLCDLASSLDIDLEAAIDETLDEVLDRDWQDVEAA